MPSRKKPKPNPPSLVDSTSNLASSAATGLAKIIGSTESRSEPNLARSASNVSSKSHQSGAAAPENPSTTSSARPTSSVAAKDENQKSPRPSQSWYGGTTQQQAAAASPAAPGAGGPVEKDGQAEQSSHKSEPGTTTPNRRAPALHLSPASAIRALPMTATTRLSISTGQNGQSEAAEPERASKKDQPDQTPSENSQPKQQSKTDVETSATEEAGTMDQAKPAGKNPTPESDKNTQPPPQSQSTWTAWFSRTQPPTPSLQAQTQPKDHPKSKSQSPPRIRPLPPSEQLMRNADSDRNVAIAPKGEQPKDKSKGNPKPAPTTSSAPQNSTPPKISEPSAAEPPSERPRSWLGLWSGSKASGTTAATAPDSSSANESTPKQDQDTPMPDAPPPEKSIRSGTPSKENLKSTADVAGSGSSWAFWSRSPANPNKASVGELAVAGSPSQSSPQRALDYEEGIPQAVNSAQGRKRGRPASLEAGEEARTSSAPPVQKKAADAVSVASVPGTPSARPGSKRASSELINLLLPQFKQTFPYESEKATILQQISHLFYGKPPSPRHPTLIRDPPRIKRALTIGIHGYFPTPLVQTVIGRPTGTSIKFAEHAARAIHNYTQSQGYSPASVEKLALEGEGRIEERLDILWKLLLNWIEKIRHADFIILACHSQGVPVAISLAAKLIGFGCVNGARIGVCAMAGVNLGPFPDYKSRWIGGTAGELFDFGRPESSVSKAYETALDTLLRFGGKVLYVGSMDDQLVSLQSSTFGSAQHPNIYRAVWIDGRVHLSDFLTHLVGFALKLRNLGVSDHGLIRELSNPLAGSLVGGEGHSRLYEDPAVYDLAVEFTAGTTSINTEVLKVDRSPSATSQNPYILPFAVRGLLEEELVRKDLASETVELIKQFDDWKPNTKVLRDVKYRLEGVRSKL